MRASGSSEGPRPLSPTFFIRYTPRSSSSRRFLLFLLPLWRLISVEAVTFFFGFSLHSVFFFSTAADTGPRVDWTVWSIHFPFFIDPAYHSFTDGQFLCS